jgi:hypothetical protein
MAPEHVALLGTMHDAEVARRTGHSLDGVRGKRQNLGIACFQPA